MNFKIIISICVLLSNILVNGQEGVGIETGNPTETLDVNGDFRLRDIPRYGTSRYLSADKDGVIGYSAKYGLSEIDVKVATNPVDYRIRRRGIYRKPLNLSTDVTIPANTEAKVVIEYSVPVGLVNYVNKGGKSIGYAGVAFYRNEGGKEREARGGSRKYTTATWSDDEYGSVVTVINKYVETFEAVNKPRTITYDLRAYVEITSSRGMGGAKYRFNMYSNQPGENRNWGKAIMTKKVYLK